MATFHLHREYTPIGGTDKDMGALLFVPGNMYLPGGLVEAKRHTPSCTGDKQLPPTPTSHLGIPVAFPRDLEAPGTSSYSPRIQGRLGCLPVVASEGEREKG